MKKTNKQRLPVHDFNHFVNSLTKILGVTRMELLMQDALDSIDKLTTMAGGTRLGTILVLDRETMVRYMYQIMENPSNAHALSTEALCLHALFTIEEGKEKKTK